jgi:hypothetical protein
VASLFSSIYNVIITGGFLSVRTRRKLKPILDLQGRSEAVPHFRAK